jgi:hypothetical protein
LQKHWTRCKNKEGDERKTNIKCKRVFLHGFSPENFGAEIVIIDIDKVRFLCEMMYSATKEIF